MRTRVIPFLLVVLVAPSVRADEPPPGEVTTAPVEVGGARVGAGEAAARTPEAARALEEPAFVSVVRVDEHQGETRSVAEALAETVGVSVRSLGGLGAFASLSMRGAPSGQTEVLLDGIPLSRIAFSSIDVGSLELAGYDQVDVYRGGVPVELGGAVLGGAVDFVTRVGPRADGAHTQLLLGGGSFGARRLRAARGDRFVDDKLATTFAVGYAGATGDFPYHDDGGTPLDPSDDTTQPRQDDDYDAVDAVARARWQGELEASGGVRVSVKDQGVPGPTGTHATQTRLGTARVVADAAVRAPRFLTDEIAAGLRGYAVVEGQHYRDPRMEVGLSVADESFLTLASGLTASAAWLPTAHQRVSTALEGRLEHFTQTDNRATDPQRATVRGDRLGAGLSVADELGFGDDDELVIVPAARLDLLATRGDGTPSPVIDYSPPAARDDAFLAPRLGVRWRPTDAVTVKGNLGRTFRAPTVIELFGDRGFVGGNPVLRPETGTTGDVGVVLAPGRALGPLDRAYLEVALFGAAMSDLIAFLPTSSRFSRAQNLDDALLGGVEVAATLRLFGALTLTGNYTYLASQQSSMRVAVDGKRLPGRPEHELYLRLDARHGVAGVVVGGFVDLTAVSGNYLDEGNLDEVPARRFLGLGVSLEPLHGLVFTAQIKNLLDARVEDVPSLVGPVPRAVADVLDYPLPGRAFYATADWTF
jgi:iron complex outermembrane receptor protein